MYGIGELPVHCRLGTLGHVSGRQDEAENGRIELGIDIPGTQSGATVAERESQLVMFHNYVKDLTSSDILSHQ